MPAAAGMVADAQRTPTPAEPPRVTVAAPYGLRRGRPRTVWDLPMRDAWPAERAWTPEVEDQTAASSPPSAGASSRAAASTSTTASTARRSIPSTIATRCASGCGLTAPTCRTSSAGTSRSSVTCPSASSPRWAARAATRATSTRASPCCGASGPTSAAARALRRDAFVRALGDVRLSPKLEDGDTYAPRIDRDSVRPGVDVVRRHQRPRARGPP